MPVEESPSPAEAADDRGAQMQAVVRRAHYEPAALAASAETMAEFERVHAAQPGFAGNIVVDLGDGERLLVTLWEDEGAATAARTTLGPRVQELLGPLENMPSELVGAGPVVRSDLEYVPPEGLD